MFDQIDMELSDRSKAVIEVSVHDNELKDKPSNGRSDDEVSKGGLDVRSGRALSLPDDIS